MAGTVAERRVSDEVSGVPLMAHEVFISHSSYDATVAREVCAALEDAGIPCWIAPRDILPGHSWSGAIVSGIEGSRVVMVVISARANGSPEVLREVELASRGRKTLVGMRVEEVAPSGDLGYFLSSTQWLNAFPSPVRPHLEGVVKVVTSLLGVEAPTPVAEQPPESEFVEVDLDDFRRSGRRRRGMKRLFEDR
jgi:hypothetical protein